MKTIWFMIWFLAEGTIGMCPINCKCSVNYVKCRNASLSEFEGLFDYNSEILEVDLRYNNIRTLKENVFSRLEKLKFLYLSTNLLEILPCDIFSELRFLKILNIFENSLKTLRIPLFRSLSVLKCLNLRKNKINMVEPGSFDSLVEVHSSNLGLNELEFLDEELFFNMHHLSYLYLDHNKLIHIYVETFSRLLNLKELSLQFNRLKALEGVLGSTRIESLDLSGNLLTTLNHSVLLSAKLLLDINLEHNRFICDCALKTSWQLLSAKKNLKLRSAKCSAPKRMKKKTVDQVLHLSCVSHLNHWKTVLISVTVIILCLFLSMLVPYFVILRRSRQIN